MDIFACCSPITPLKKSTSGRAESDPEKLRSLSPLTENTLTGHILRIDNFGNLITQ
jgi:S-adenosylmethionine hydrolase